MTSTWQGPKKCSEPFLAVNKYDSSKGHQFEGNEEYDFVVDPETCWRFYKRVGKPAEKFVRIAGQLCQQLRHRRQRGTKLIGRRAIGILSILQALTIDVIFLRVRTGFGCLEKNLQPTDGVL